MLRLLAFRILVIAMLVGSILPAFETDRAVAADGPIIADHEAVAKFEDIPADWIAEVKKMLLSVPGESHSEAYREGLELLGADSTYQVINYEDQPPLAGDNQSLRVTQWVYNNPNMPESPGTGEAQWYTWHAWDPEDLDYPTVNATVIKSHIDYINTNNLGTTAIGFGWCYDMSFHNYPTEGKENIGGVEFGWAGASEGGPDGDKPWGLDDADYDLTVNHVDMDDYLAATVEYINAVPISENITVFFTTGPVDGNENSEIGYQREIKQEYIREHFDDVYPNAVLFDYADILTHNDAGQLHEDEWNGYTYPQIHPDNMEGDPIGHIGEVGALRLGKALWWMLARIAGWDGEPVTEHISITISGAAAAGIDFGSLVPGEPTILEKHSSNVTPSIVVTVVTAPTNVDLQIKGTDFDVGTFPVSTASYSFAYESTKIPMSTDYTIFALDKAPGENVELWHWLTVPSGVAAGVYQSTFSYKAIAHQQ